MKKKKEDFGTITSDRIIVDVIEVKPREKTKSGLYVASATGDVKSNADDVEIYFDKHPYQGIVMAVGPGFYSNGHLTPMEIKPGDHVYCRSTANEVLVWNEKIYNVVRQSDVITYIRKEK